MSAESEAIGRAIARAADSSGEEPPEHWQAVLDDLEPFVDSEIISNTSIAFRYVAALRDRKGRASTAEGRARCVEDATFFLGQALRFPHDQS